MVLLLLAGVLIFAGCGGDHAATPAPKHSSRPARGGGPNRLAVRAMEDSRQLCSTTSVEELARDYHSAPDEFAAAHAYAQASYSSSALAGAAEAGCLAGLRGR